MAKKKTASNVPATVKTSWLPAGYEVGSILAGAGWSPEVGESRCLEITGFEIRKSTVGEKDYMIVTACDLQTGEEFSFAPGGLFQWLMDNDRLHTGDKVAMRYKGEKKLPNGFKANDWDIVRLKG